MVPWRSPVPTRNAPKTIPNAVSEGVVAGVQTTTAMGTMVDVVEGSVVQRSRNTTLGTSSSPVATTVACPSRCLTARRAGGCLVDASRTTNTTILLGVAVLFGTPASAYGSPSGGDVRVEEP